MRVEGEYLASSLRSGAGMARRQGSAYRQAGYVSSGTTALSGAVSWADKCKRSISHVLAWVDLTRDQNW